MGTARHHPSDALLMAYSAGALPEAFDLVIATHLSLCDACRASVESFDTVGGALLEDAQTADLSDDAMSRTMELIRGHDRNSGMHWPVRAAASVFPEPLRSYAGVDAADMRWRAAGGGVRQKILTTAKGATARLLCIPAGAEMPDHGHRGTELTLVLQGAFVDEDQRFARGDIEVATQVDNHRPVAEAGSDCICLAATDAPLRFSGLLPRIAAPFLRI